MKNPKTSNDLMIPPFYLKGISRRNPPLDRQKKLPEVKEELQVEEIVAKKKTLEVQPINKEISKIKEILEIKQVEEIEIQEEPKTESLKQEETKTFSEEEKPLIKEVTGKKKKGFKKTATSITPSTVVEKLPED